MCGIAAILLHPENRSAKDWRAIKHAFTMNLLSNEPRGTAATGIAVVDISGEVCIHKSPVPASRFIEATEYQRVIADVGSQTTLILGHTRMPTKGDPGKNENNHPIRAGTVVGVHNGELTNDDELFAQKRYARSGEVDSEIIFRVLEHLDPIILGDKYLGEVSQHLCLIHGECTFLALDLRRPEQLLVTRHSNPLAVYLHEEWNALVFSSRFAYLRRMFGTSLTEQSLPHDHLMLFDATEIDYFGYAPKRIIPSSS